MRRYLLGNPATLYFSILSQQFQYSFFIKSRQCNANCRCIESANILLRSKQAHIALGILVCLHSFKTTKRIVEYCCGWIERKSLVGLYTRSAPTFFGIPCCGKYVIYRFVSISETRHFHIVSDIRCYAMNILTGATDQ